MSVFERAQRRLNCLGVQLTRAFDACDPGKWPFLRNIRSIVQGTIQSRPGYVALAGGSFGSAVRSITRFDDSTPFATHPQLYVIGAGGNVYAGAPGGGSYGLLDSGYSGDPLSFVSATPPQSPQPFLYIADPDRMRKINADGAVYEIGIAAPLDEPTTALQALGYNIIESFDEFFIPFITIGTGAPESSIATPFRVNTTISQILYDNGAAPGYASIVPVVSDGIGTGILITVNSAETVAVTNATIAVAPTTIAAILYDSGSTGLCTIQPAGSLGTGQLQTPTFLDVLDQQGVSILTGTRPGHFTNELPLDSRIPSPGGAQSDLKGAPISQSNFPVDCLVTLASETVRILSATLGRDGVQSFRCSTAIHHGVGETVVGVTAFRAWVNGTFGPGATLVDKALSCIITPSVPNPQSDPPSPATATAGFRTGSGWPPKNLAYINGRATLPDDDIRLSVRLSDCVVVQTVRLYLSLKSTASSSPSGADFTENYYFFEWRQSDLSVAIQRANTSPTQTLEEARQIQLTNEQLAQPKQVATVQEGIVEYLKRVNALAAQKRTVSSPLALGNNQWLELRCKVSQLVHVGTDTSKTLANVTAAEVLFSISDDLTENPVTVAVDAMWMSGGFQPDTSGVAPYVYCYRYRSSVTGNSSNPSPPTRGTITPQRQSILVTGTPSTDPQVDLVDWFRQGGAISTWTYAGTTPNGSPLTFLDVYDDSAISGGETLVYDSFQPFPTQDITHTGVCNASGTAVDWVAGDLFETDWAPGSLIIFNGQSYSLYSSPPTTTRLYINENAGAVLFAEFSIPAPTILSSNFGAIFGGPIGGSVFMFGVRNPIDPGTVNWTNGNNPEAASDKNALQVTAASEPLQNGFMWDGVPFVASTENLYVLEPTFGQVSAFRPLITPCGRGFWTPWAFCVAPEGVYFLAKDGIFLTTGGSGAISITNDDLYPLFPHDGEPGRVVNGYYPVDMASTQALRLAYVDGWVIFDYNDAQGSSQTLSYRVSDRSWWPDKLAQQATVRAAGVGDTVHEMLIGTANGNIFVQGGFTDAGTVISCAASMIDNQGDARRFKLYRDVFFQADLAGQNATLVASFTNGINALPPVAIVGLSGIQNYVIDTVPQTGIYGTNIQIQLFWVPTAFISQIWQVVDVAFQMEPELASSWLSGPTTNGSRGYQQIPRALIAYISTSPVTLSMILDGVTYTYTLPSTAGKYAKNQIVLRATKFKTVQYGLQCPTPFLHFDRDDEFWTQVWGQQGGYVTVKPF